VNLQWKECSLLLFRNRFFLHDTVKNAIITQAVSCNTMLPTFPEAWLSSKARMFRHPYVSESSASPEATPDE
jgi:hypothetical protein